MGATVARPSAAGRDVSLCSGIREDGVRINLSPLGHTPLLPAENGRWEYEDLRRIRERCDSYGLKLEALENVPRHFYDKAMLGLPGRDQQIENYRQTIRNMARAGIPMLGYNWMPNWVWRTPNETGRGGVRVSNRSRPSWRPRTAPSVTSRRWTCATAMR